MSNEECGGGWKELIISNRLAPIQCSVRQFFKIIKSCSLYQEKYDFNTIFIIHTFHVLVEHCIQLQKNV